MTDKIVAIAAMLDATDGEQDNASRILQRMLASRDCTLIEFISGGLDRIGVEYGLRQDILSDVQFPFNAERIDRITEKLRANGLSWRSIARGTNGTDRDERNNVGAGELDPYDLQFLEGRRQVVSMPPGKKALYEWPRESLPPQIIALVRPRERNGDELRVSAYTQDAETVIAFGDFTISGADTIEAVLTNVGIDRAMMFQVDVPRNPAKPMTLRLI